MDIKYIAKELTERLNDTLERNDVKFVPLDIVGYFERSKDKDVVLSFQGFDVRDYYEDKNIVDYNMYFRLYWKEDIFGTLQTLLTAFETDFRIQDRRVYVKGGEIMEMQGKEVFQLTFHLII